MPLLSSQNVANLCCSCNKPSENIKVCGKCRMVRYCSVECQKGAWKMHKQSCSTGPREAAKRSREFATAATALSQWVAHWRTPIYTVAGWVLDLPNSPKDRLQTHVVALGVVQTKESGPTSQLFTLISGTVCTREQVVRMMQAHFPNPIDAWVDTYKNDRRGEDTVQIILYDEVQIRTLWFSYPDMEIMRTPLPNGVPDILGDLQKDWVNKLGDMLGAGITDGTLQLFLQAFYVAFEKITGENAKERKAMVRKCYMHPETLARFGVQDLPDFMKKSRRS